MLKKNQYFRLTPIVACLAVMFSIGIVYLWSVFQQPVIDHYGWSPASVAMISSSMISMFVLGTLIGGFIQDRRSPRFVIILGGVLFFTGLLTTSLLDSSHPWLIYVTYGALAGCGVGFAYSGALSCIQKWLPQKLGLATGISVCAFGLSVVAFAPLIEWLLKLPAFGDRAVPLTFRTLAIAFTGVILIAGMFVRNPGAEYLVSLDLPHEQANKRQYTPGEAIRTAPFWCLAVTMFFLPAAYMIIIPLVKTLAAVRGVPEAQASLTVSLMGVVSAAARLLCGAVSDRLGGAKTVFILGIVTLIASLLMTFAGGWLYTIAVLLITFGYGGPAGIFPAMATDMFGAKYSGTNYGRVFMFVGVSAPFFTMLSNKLSADGAATGNYTLSFLVSAAVCVIPLTALPLFDYFKNKRFNEDIAAKSDTI